MVDEWIALEILRNRQALLDQTMGEMRRRLDLVSQWIESEDRLEWVRPSGGVVCLPRMRGGDRADAAGFYQRLLGDHQTYVGPGHWFELPDTFFRLGFGWPTFVELEAGLAAISSALRG